MVRTSELRPTMTCGARYDNPFTSPVLSLLSSMAQQLEAAMAAAEITAPQCAKSWQHLSPVGGARSWRCSPSARGVRGAKSQCRPAAPAAALLLARCARSGSRGAPLYDPLDDDQEDVSKIQPISVVLCHELLDFFTLSCSCACTAGFDRMLFCVKSFVSPGSLRFVSPAGTFVQPGRIPNNFAHCRPQSDHSDESAVRHTKKRRAAPGRSLPRRPRPGGSRDAHEA